MQLWTMDQCFGSSSNSKIFWKNAWLVKDRPYVGIHDQSTIVRWRCRSIDRPKRCGFHLHRGFLFFMRIFLSLHATFHDRPDTVHQNAFLMATIWVLCRNFPFKRRSINVLLLHPRDLQKLASYRRKWKKNREKVFQWILRSVSFDFYHFYEQPSFEAYFLL